MSDHIVAVGGSGQDIALCYCRLAVMCGVTPASVTVLDADRTGDVSGAFKNLLSVYSGWRHKYLNPYPSSVEAGTPPTLAQVLAANDPRANRALGVFFTSEQQQVRVSEGMFGRPPVGAATIMAKLVEAKERPGVDRDLSELLEVLSVGGTRQVILVGSTFGGTGSGGVPALARYLRSNLRADGVRIGALVLTPWFHLLPPDPAKVSAFMLDQEAIRRNGSSWVAYYRDELKKDVDRLIFLGFKDPVQRPNAGSVRQPEHKHAFYLLGAYLLHQELVSQDLSRSVKSAEAYYHNPARPIDLASLSIRRHRDSIPFIQGVREMNAMLEFLKALERYLRSLPQVGHLFPLFPTLEVHPWLRRMLAAMGSQDPQVGADSLCEALRLEYGALEAIREWFSSLGLDSQDPGARFRITQSQDFPSRRYAKDRSSPLDTIRHWMDLTARRAASFEEPNAPLPPEESLPRLREFLRATLRDTIIERYVARAAG